MKNYQTYMPTLLYRHLEKLLSKTYRCVAQAKDNSSKNLSQQSILMSWVFREHKFAVLPKVFKAPLSKFKFRVFLALFSIFNGACGMNEGLLLKLHNEQGRPKKTF